MSSPIASQEKTVVKKRLIDFHQRYSHQNRVTLLASKIAQVIRLQLGTTQTNPQIKCLDVGCGDMKISTEVSNQLPFLQWQQIDLYELPENLKNDPKWSLYKKFDGRTLPFADQSLDFVLFCDVLHHCADDQLTLLQEACRVSSYVIVKDHFEYSWFSRSVLQLMDIVGNWGYGVSIPKKYLTQSSFKDLVRQAQLEIVDLEVGIQLYQHLPIAKSLLSPKWQFVAVLRKKSC